MGPENCIFGDFPEKCTPKSDFFGPPTWPTCPAESDVRVFGVGYGNAHTSIFSFIRCV